MDPRRPDARALRAPSAEASASPLRCRAGRSDSIVRWSQHLRLLALLLLWTSATSASSRPSAQALRIAPGADVDPFEAPLCAEVVGPYANAVVNRLAGNPGEGTRLFDYAPTCQQYTPRPGAPLTFAAHRQVLTLFLNPAVPRPAAGAPVILFTGAGFFQEPLACLRTERGPDRTIAPNVLGDLYALFEAGWAIAIVGTTGIDDPDAISAPNLFHPHGTPEWNDSGLQYAEKEFVWARQFVSLHANALGLDNDTVLAYGRSAGAVYAAYLALGPERDTFDSVCPSDPLWTQATRCAGFLALDIPAWIPAWTQTTRGSHWEDASAPGQAAPTLAAADLADLRLNSPSGAIRACGSNARDTPVLMLFDEAFCTGSACPLDFARDPSTVVVCPPGGDPTPGDPVEFDRQDILAGDLLHPAWSAIVLAQDLRGIEQEPDFHETRSALLLREDEADLEQLTDDELLLIDGFFPEDLREDEWLDQLLAWTGQFQGLADAQISSTLGAGNVDLLTSSTAPFVGSAWPSQLDLTSVGPTDSVLYAFSMTTASVPDPASGGTLLVQAPYLDLRFVPLSGETTLDADFALPTDPASVGVALHLQATIELSGGDSRLTNRLTAIPGYVSR